MTTKIMPAQLSAGRVLAHPGRKTALAASTVAIADGCIAAVTPTDASDDGLLMLPALVDAHNHGRGLRSFAYGVHDQAL